MGKGKQVKGKSSKKVKQDSFLKKEWRHVFVPGIFKKTDIGFTVSHKCARGRTPGDYLNKRIFETSHGDLVEEQSHAYRLFTWQVIEVEKDDVLTYFHGMRVSRDKLCSILRKYRTLIEAQVDAKTPDGFILRMFCIGFTKKINTHKKACYAQQSKRRQIRDKMVEEMKQTIESNPVTELCKAIVDETIEAKITNECASIMAMEAILISKVSVIKSPQLTTEQLRKLHNSRQAAPVVTDTPTEEVVESNE